MYMQRGQFGAARASYQRVEVNSRVEGASPHQLVTILFEEMLKSLDAMALAADRGDYQKRSERQAKVLRVISGLEVSLDFDNGGDIAIGLARIYREARRLVVEGGRENDSAKLMEAREMLAQISTAWSDISGDVAGLASAAAAA